jgi:hypothetical protein
MFREGSLRDHRVEPIAHQLPTAMAIRALRQGPTEAPLESGEPPSGTGAANSVHLSFLIVCGADANGHRISMVLTGG